MSNLHQCSNDCDLLHCAKCGCHTAGDTLVAGLCQDCYTISEDEYNRFMEDQYHLALAGFPSVFDKDYN